MDIVHRLLVVLHFIGMAGVIGGALTQLSSTRKTVLPAMLWGARAQIITGILLVGISEPNVNHAKVGLKLLIALAVTALYEMNNRKGLNDTTYQASTGLALLNVLVAVLWSTEPS